jgi:chromosome segregation ATPase
MANRIALYRKTLRELYKELHELEDTLQYLETRKRPSAKKILEAEDNIDDCQDDIDIVRRMVNRLLRIQKPVPKKKPAPKKPTAKRKPFEAPHVQRKPAPVQRHAHIAPDEEDDKDYDRGWDGNEERSYVERYGEDALEDLEEFLEDFPELDEYINDDIFEMDDEDFYSGDNK